MKKFTLGILVMAAMACSPINKPVKQKGTTGLVDKQVTSSPGETESEATVTVVKGDAPNDGVFPDGDPTQKLGSTAPDRQPDGKKIKLNKVRKGQEEAASTDVYSDGVKGEVERAMVQDPALLAKIREVETNAKADCLAPRIGQIHRDATCDDHCCRFTLDVSCVSRVMVGDKPENTQDNNGVYRISIQGEFDYGMKTTSFFDFKYVTNQAMAISPVAGTAK